VSEELAYLGAAELARRIRAREVSPVDVVSVLGNRAERLNGALNAIVTPMPGAEERAREAEAAVARGDDLPPLHGVPFTIKDSFDTAGVRTTRGSRLFADHVPDRDAAVVSRVVAAGGIPLGKTNLPDFALWWETDNLVFGRTRNPWDLERSAGGSSGGEAAAVAAGLSPLGIGSDLGGSIRLPAHYCGVVGLKPTHGRIPVTGHWPDMLQRFLHAGFLARSVEDVSLALSVTAGPDGEDPYAPPVPVPPAGTDRVPGDLRVGLVTHAFGAVEPEVVELVERAGRALTELGASVETALFPALERHDWNVTTMVLYGGGGGAYLDRIIAGRHDDLHPALRVRLSKRVESIAEYVAAEEAVEELRLDAAAFFRAHHVLLCPTVPRAAHEHDASELEIAGETYPARAAMRATIPWDISGSPALTVPFGMSLEGLPLGIQLVGRHFDEPTLFAAGHALELARGPLRSPPLDWPSS
jgi:aspartyl-tRNA(Asn)/glutamyl-tRNA(Gln) amidotransferase subunit A